MESSSQIPSGSSLLYPEDYLYFFTADKRGKCNT